MKKMHLYLVDVKGDLGLKKYHIITEVGGLKGGMEAKEVAEARYKEELELSKDRVEASEPRELEVGQGPIFGDKPE
jgi:hypothetical protein